MADTNTIKVITEYLQKNQDDLKEFRADLQGLADDTENASASAKEHESATDSESLSITDLYSAVGLVKQGYELLNAVYDETIAKTLEQGNVIRELKSVTGDSAEEISRAVQVLDDYKISSDSLLSSQKFLAKQGLSLNIETLAQLSAEYVKLGSVQERSKFLTDNLGKSGLVYAEIMGKGEDAIRAQGEAVADGLIFGDKQLDQMRELEMHQDSLNDNWTAIKNNVSMSLIPVLDDLTTSWIDGTRAQEILAEQGESTTLPVYSKLYKAALAQAQAEREAADAAMLHNEQLIAETDSEAELAAAIETANQARQGSLGLMQNIASLNQDFIEQQAQVQQKQADIQAEIDELIAQGWTPLSQKVQDLQQDYNELGLKYDENAIKHQEATNKILYDLTISKLSVEGLTDAEYLLAQQAGLAFGQLDQNAIDTAKNFDAVAQAVADGRLKVEDMQRALDLLPALKNIDVVVTTINKTINSGPAYNPYANYNSGYAEGGISTGPQSGHVELLHGTEAVIPLENGSIPVQLSGEGNSEGQKSITISVQISSPMTFMDEHNAVENIRSYVMLAARQLRAEGLL